VTKTVDVDTEAKTEAAGFETEAEAVKIVPRGSLEARQCLEAPHHCYQVQLIGLPAESSSSKTVKAMDFKYDARVSGVSPDTVS